MNTVLRHLIPIIVLAFSMPFGASAEDRLKLLYEDRPPYYFTGTDGRIGGLAIDPVKAALAKAGISPDWRVSSAKRQIASIRADREPVCSPGWFKKPEREAFAKFSVPIYRDRPQVVVTRADNALRINHGTLEKLLRDPNLTMGVKLGYSYGQYIDALIERLEPVTMRSSQDVHGLIRMLVGRRFDYMLAAPEEFSSMAARLGIAGEDIVSVTLSDIPDGNDRYLMCSRKVSDEWLARINAALAE
jgi:polar amino acid transport system substrate-binding protein